MWQVNSKQQQKQHSDLICWKSEILKKGMIRRDIQNLSYFIWDVVDLFCLFGQTTRRKGKTNKRTNCESEEINQREADSDIAASSHLSSQRGQLLISPAHFSPLRAHSREMAAAKTEMLLPALQISDPLSFPHSPMDNYPKLEEMIMLNSAGTPFLNASAPEGTGFGSGEPGDHFDHLTGGKQKIPLD